MKYIAELFRSRQQDQALFTAPFTSAQTAALLAGETPTGPLY